MWGALLQELIDVTVILNAPRALRPGGANVRLAATDAALTRRFQAEHESIRASIGTLRTAADEIAHQIRRLGQLLDDIGPDPPDETDLADLHSLLYGLHAILRLHTAQEDESYLSLSDDAEGPSPGSSSVTTAPPPGRLRASARPR